MPVLHHHQWAQVFTVGNILTAIRNDLPAWAPPQGTAGTYAADGHARAWGLCEALLPQAQSLEEVYTTLEGIRANHRPVELGQSAVRAFDNVVNRYQGAIALHYGEPPPAAEPVIQQVADAAVLVDPAINGEVAAQVKEQDFLALGNNALQNIARVWPMLPAGERRKLGMWMAAWFRAVGIPEAADALETYPYA